MPDPKDAERLGEAQHLLEYRCLHKDGFVRADAPKQVAAVLAQRDATIARLTQERNTALASLAAKSQHYEGLLRELEAKLVKEQYKVKTLQAELAELIKIGSLDHSIPVYPIRCRSPDRFEQ